MAIGVILGIIFIIVAIGLCIGAYCSYDGGRPVGAATCIILAIASCLAFIIVPFSFHTINTGEVAVVKHLGKITHVREAGTCFDFWMINSYQKYDTKVQNVEITTAAYSSDAQTMDVVMTLQYQIMPEHVTDIATQYGTLDVLQNRIQSIVIEKTKAVLSAHKAMDIIATRANISPEVEAAVKAAVDEDYFVSITAVVLTNIDFSDSFEKAVEDKMVAEQAKLKADYDNETKLAKAEADAKALMIQAEAEAKANELLTKSLTDQVLEAKFYEKWDGKLPQVMGEGSAILDIRDNEE
jgi:regulator of protease activity HflC (stomatin/prohibitin superfamily)